MNEKPETAEPTNQQQRRPRTVLVALIAVAAAALNFLGPLFIVVFVVQPVRVEGTAMWPTLNDGDRILLSKRTTTLRRGDIIVFYYPKDTSKSFVKRIIGLPGDSIDVDLEGNV